MKRIKATIIATLLLVTVSVFLIKLRDQKPTYGQEIKASQSIMPSPLVSGPSSNETRDSIVAPPLPSDSIVSPPLPSQSRKQLSQSQKPLPPPNPEVVADRIWGKVVHTSGNDIVDLKVFENGVCQLLPKNPGKDFHVKEGLDPLVPIPGTNWPIGVAIKIRNASGEILGQNAGFTSGWINPNWGGAFAMVSPSNARLVPLDWHFDTLDLASLAGTMKSRIPELEDPETLDYKLKVIFSTTEMYQKNGARVRSEDLETDWINGRNLKDNQ